MNVQQGLLADKASLEKAISLDEMKMIWLQGVVELENGAFVFRQIRKSDDVTPEVRVSYRAKPGDPILVTLVTTEAIIDYRNGGIDDEFYVFATLLNWIADVLPHVDWATTFPSTGDAFVVEEPSGRLWENAQPWAYCRS